MTLATPLLSLDIVIVRGVSLLPITVPVTDGDSPLDLTGASVSSKIRDSKGVEVATIGAEITDAPGGIITVFMAPEDTQAIDIGGYCWDLILTLADSTVAHPLVGGRAVVQRTATLY